MAEKPLGRTVLLVDDEVSVRRYVASVLQREGFQVLEAADGVEGLALLREIRGAVDVLVTDIKMPRMNGIALVEAARIDFPGIRVVYISGELWNQELHSPERGMIFLQKPFLLQAILDAVRGIVPKTASA